MAFLQTVRDHFATAKKKMNPALSLFSEISEKLKNISVSTYDGPGHHLLDHSSFLTGILRLMDTTIRNKGEVTAVRVEGAMNGYTIYLPGQYALFHQRCSNGSPRRARACQCQGLLGSAYSC